MDQKTVALMENVRPSDDSCLSADVSSSAVVMVRSASPGSVRAAAVASAKKSMPVILPKKAAERPPADTPLSGRLRYAG